MQTTSRGLPTLIAESATQAHVFSLNPKSGRTNDVACLQVELKCNSDPRGSKSCSDPRGSNSCESNMMMLMEMLLIFTDVLAEV